MECFVDKYSWDSKCFTVHQYLFQICGGCIHGASCVGGILGLYLIASNIISSFSLEWIFLILSKLE